MGNKIKFVPMPDYKGEGSEIFVEDCKRVEPLLNEISYGRLFIRTVLGLVEYRITSKGWYLVGVDTEDTYDFFYLFPWLPAREYSDLDKHYNRLSKLWKQRVSSYKSFMRLREISRDIKKWYMKDDN